MLLQTARWDPLTAVPSVKTSEETYASGTPTSRGLQMLKASTVVTSSSQSEKVVLE
jgi:hypothetical protein